jgi:hypothetical protein
MRNVQKIIVLGVLEALKHQPIRLQVAGFLKSV